MRSGLIFQEVDSFPGFGPRFPWPRLNQLLDFSFPFRPNCRLLILSNVYNRLHGKGLTSDEEL